VKKKVNNAQKPNRIRLDERGKKNQIEGRRKRTRQRREKKKGIPLRRTTTNG
jgi:hypothetical protein